MATEKNSKKTPNFICEICDFKSCKQNEYNRHIETVKHKRLHEPTEKSTNIEPKIFNCICGKKYNHHTSLSKHKRDCLVIHKNTNTNTNTETNNEPTTENDNGNGNDNGNDNGNENIILTKEMFMAIINDRQEMLKIIKSLSENSICNSNANNTTNSNNTTTNSHNTNNTFNMNMFLNEKCKDAMNMKDFVNSIQLNMTDMENMDRLGYVEGMSTIFIDNLKKTDVYKRPVHCSDMKRDTLYVKENDQWEREGSDHAKMTKAVLAVEHKNVVLVNEWANANPRCLNSTTRENEKYFRLSTIVTDGDKEGNIAKVIRKVAKCVGIERSCGSGGTTYIE